MNRISALIKDTPERPPSIYLARARQEDDPLGTRQQALTRYRICQGPDCGLAASRAVINFSYLLSQPVFGIFIIAAKTD